MEDAPTSASATAQEKALTRRVENVPAPGAGIESAAVKEPERTPEKIASELRETDAQIESEVTKLNDLQTKLGVQPSDSSGYIEELRVRRDRLQEEHEAQPGGQNENPEQDFNQEEANGGPQIESAQQQEKENQERAQLKHELANAEESLTRLSNVFRRREEDHLYTLLEKDDISGISFGARRMADAVKVGSVEYDAIVQGLGSVRRGLENYGRYRSSGPLREDTDSLQSIEASLHEVSAALEQVRRSLAADTDRRAQEASAAIAPVSAQLETVLLHSVRSREALERYLRG